MARMDGSRVRRSLIALLVAGLVAVGLAAALASVQALAGDDLPETFQVRAPHVGDRGVYNLTLHGDWQYDDFEEGVPFEFVRFGWGEDTRALGEDGRMHDANTLSVDGLAYSPFTGIFGSADEEEQQHWSPVQGTWHYVPGGQDAVGYGSEQQESMHNEGQSTVLGVPITQHNLSGEFGFRTYRTDVPGFCFLRTPLQDAAMPTDRPVDFQACTLGGLEGWETKDSGALRAVGTERLQGLSTVRFDSDTGFSVWYAQELSAPVRIQVPSPTMVDLAAGQTQEMAGHAVLDLVAFEPGTRPVAVQAASPYDVLPAFQPAARMPWGMPDGDVDRPFPASEAYEAALADEDAGLSEYLDAHPDAVPIYQTSSVVHWPDEDLFRWRLGFSDGDEAYGVQVDLAIERPGRYLTGSDLPLPEAATHTVEVAEDPFLVHYSQTLDFDPIQVPTEVPTAASALERWRVAIDRADLPDLPAYGLELVCHEGCSYRVTAGVDTTDLRNGQGVAGAVGSSSLLAWDLSWAAMRPDGGVESLFELLADFEVTREVAAPAGGVEPTATSAQAAPSTAARIVLPTTPEETAAVGIAAFLAGLTYWFWPALKATPVFGLFSRLKRPELLEHPKRRTIHEAIAAAPGVHFKGLQRATGLANGTLRHHLRHLVAGGLVVERAGARYTCYFPKGRVDARAMEAASLLKSDGSRAVLEEVQRRPGITAREVADRTGLSPGTVAYHVDRLARCGAVQKGRQGRAIGLQASSWVTTALEAA